jgi:TolB protein
MMISRPGQDQPTVVNRSRVFLLALAILATSIACLAVNRFSLSQPAPTSAAPQGLIAYVGSDGNIYTTDPAGKQVVAITRDANLNPATGEVGRYYQYPAWAPDGQHLAYVRFSADSSGAEASLFSASSDGKEAVNAFTSKNFQPFYLSWSPDSRSIAFLGGDGSGALSQYMVAASGGESKLVGSGQPYYWDWSPDGGTLIVHVGGARSANPDAHLAFIGLEGSNTEQTLDLKPASFQAPAWSPAGDAIVLAVENEAGKEQLILSGKDGKPRQVLARLDGPVAFAWSPQGTYLAYADLDLDGSVPTAHMFLLDTSHPDLHHQVAEGELVAFFWSPDGTRIAYFSLEREGPSASSFQTVAQAQPSTSLVVRVYDRVSGETKAVASIVPTLAFQQVLPFYSQYQRSATVWSPDSQHLVLSGIDSNGEDAIYTVDAGGGPLQKIADGDLAFWSWK